MSSLSPSDDEVEVVYDSSEDKTPLSEDQIEELEISDWNRARTVKYAEELHKELSNEETEETPEENQLQSNEIEDETDLRLSESQSTQEISSPRCSDKAVQTDNFPPAGDSSSDDEIEEIDVVN